jgi:competence ComEA-like helix-hairpin-helix protein
MKWKKVVVDYFSFTRKERIGVLGLVFFIFLFLLLPRLINNKTNSSFAPADTSWITAVKRLETKEITGKDRKLFSSTPDDNSYAHQYDHSVTSSFTNSLFYFDPNTLDAIGWKKLGLSDKTIHIIQNYLSKGGHFYKSDDLQKIYGIRQNEYERLAPYIKIESSPAKDNTTGYSKKEKEPARTYYSIIDINTADTSSFIALPGIGAKLASRIVTFRDKLGGFYSIEQVGETYGLPDSTFQKIKQYLKLENTSVKKININTATVDELKAHPYIRYSIANPVVAYRNEHGPFSKIEDIKKVIIITDEVYKKIAPYLTL